MSMELDALKFLVEEAKRPEVIDVEGRPYSTRNPSPVLDPMVKCLTIHTLQGIVDFLSENTEVQDKSKVFIHIKSHEEVNLMGFVSGQWKQREFYLQATLPNESRFRFNHWISVEDMIIELHSKFVPCEELTKLISLLSRVEDGVFNVCEDDGISQEVTLKRKIQGTLTDTYKISPRINLPPYRTFIEVDQPFSPFVIRLKHGMEAALFDTDSGKWKLDAIQNIKDWLQDRLPVIKIIA